MEQLDEYQFLFLIALIGYFSMRITEFFYGTSPKKKQDHE